jgi:hypothetical protein
MDASFPRLVSGACGQRHQLLAGQNGTREVAGGINFGAFRRSARGFARQPVERSGDQLFLRGNRKLLGLLSLREQHFLKQAAALQESGRACAAPDSPLSDRFKNSAPTRRQRFFDAIATAPTFYGLFDWEMDQDCRRLRLGWMDGNGSGKCSIKWRPRTSWSCRFRTWPR